MRTISNAREYFDEVVNYNLQQFKSQPTHLPSAFNFANSLFSMHEWLWVGSKKELQVFFKKTFETKYAFSKYVQSDSNAFKHMRDLANASKHVFLNDNASTSAKHITDTGAIEDDYFEADYVEEGYVLGKGIYINDGGNDVDFEDCADEVYDYWHKLLMKLDVETLG